MFDLALPSALALVAGVSVVIQQVLNANLRSDLNSAVWSGFMSYFLGVLCMVGLAIMLREPIPPARVVACIPWWAGSGGLFGAIFIGLSILVAHQLGASTLIVGPKRRVVRRISSMPTSRSIAAKERLTDCRERPRWCAAAVRLRFSTIAAKA
jgi:hypothetical protein